MKKTGRQLLISAVLAVVWVVLGIVQTRVSENMPLRVLNFLTFAQGGIFVPAKKFEYSPVDMIFSHFPADEDKTTDLGRLGEECVRFKEIFNEATSDSLILLNETFSTTSFEEGYYIATDAVKALSSRKIRAIYNTHMHKLAVDSQDKGKGISSIVMLTDKGQRSFKAVLMPPEGLSYARDIAEKYGVTYEMLTGG